MNNIFKTKTQTALGYRLFVVGADGVERELGMAVGADPSERRSVTPNFVIGNNPPDEPQEIVPQVVSEKTLRFERIALFDLTVLQAFVNPGKATVTDSNGRTVADPVIATLAGQTVPLKIIERITDPNTSKTKTRTYEGCIVTDWSSTRNMGRGDIREMENVSITYLRVTETAYQ